MDRTQNLVREGVKKPMSYEPFRNFLSLPPPSREAETVFLQTFGEKPLVRKEKYVVFNGYPCKKVTKYFCIYISISEQSASFSLFQKKNLFLLRTGGLPPPPGP